MMVKKGLRFLTAMLLGSLTLGTIVTLEASAKDAAAPAPTMKKKPQAEPSIWEQLKLDATQKKQLSAVRAKRTNAISKVLNKDQKAKFDQLRGKQKLSAILSQLNLDANQKKAVAAANEQAQKDILNILKPEQKTQLNAYLSKNKQTAE
jgi:Spy/CpxP family protein refolding chaperone